MQMTLDQAQVGQQLLVQAINDDATATMAVRLGIHTGEIVTVVSKVPGGPLVVARGKLEIALGRQLCQMIQVAPLDATVQANVALS